jgi:L-iditol 2-dehydrogenase
MLAYIYEGEGKLSLKDIPKPLIKSDTALMKVNACSICGTDLRTYVFGSSKIIPQTTIGHEAVGTIVEIGSSVKNFKVGDRVAVAPAIGCGKCPSCLAGHTNMCDDLKSIGFQFNGGFAEYMEIPAIAFERGNVNRIKSSLPSEEATLAEPLACVINSHTFLNIKKGDTVAIFGSGFIGYMHVELAFRSGASKVIMIEVSEKRVLEAKSLIPNITIINPKEVDTDDEIAKITEGKGVDVAIVACSAGAAQESAIKIAGKHARISLFGGLPNNSKGFIDSNSIHYKELSVFGVHASTSEQNRAALELIASGKINVKKYITVVAPLKDIENTFQSIKSGNILKAIIKPFPNEA